MEYGLIGEKLGHSFSKQIHQQLADYDYELLALNHEAFKTFMIHKDFKAINVTIPYKQAVLPYLDEIDEQAKAIGAVNTIVNDQGRLIGHNSDYLGFIYLLDKHNIIIQHKKVIVLGNGGAAQAVKAACKHLNVGQLLCVKKHLSDETITYEELYEKHQDAQIIINTSPVGMYPNNQEQVIDLSLFHQCVQVIDIIYNPLRTILVQAAIDQGIDAIGGLEMLVAQGFYAAEFFLNQKLAIQRIDEIYHQTLRDKSNIVLIGMPSCGKTTIGKKCAALLNKTFVDTDEEIIKEINMSIKDYFEQFEEASFRKIECKVCERLSKENNLVIATGGGIIKDATNIFHLKQNGLLLYIKREPSKLLIDPSRPLSKDRQAIMTMYHQRHPSYLKSAHEIITNDGTLEDACNQIIKLYENRQI
ncbi:MAG: shikimate kinase [Erysipelotrichaceae bacterium]